MPEVTGIVVQPESELAVEYPFVQKLAVDHPDLARSVQAKIGPWKAEMDIKTGRTDVGEALLQSIDYVSSSEIDSCVGRWAQEVTDALTQRPEQKIVILRGVGGSQDHFGQRVYDQIPEALRDRVTIIGGDPMLNRMTGAAKDLDTFLDTDFYLFDDSINSGQQVKNMLMPKFARMTDRIYDSAQAQSCGQDFFDLVDGKTHKPAFRIRSMRITHYGQTQLEERWQLMQQSGEMGRMYGSVMDLDIQTAGIMPTVNEVLAPLNIEWPDNDLPGYLYSQRHVAGDPIVGFFATKIQDNLPGALCQSTMTPKDITPLFDMRDIQTPWKKNPDPK